MRQFLLAKNVAYASSTNIATIADGAIGIYYNKDGVPTPTQTGAEITKEAMIVLGRTANNGGPVVLPLYKNNFSFSKMVYDPAVKFKTVITLTAPTKVGDYTLIVVAKGKKFNERNKWTSMVHVTDTTMTAGILAEKLKESINSNNGNNVVVTISGSTITIEGLRSGEDFEVIGADLLMGTTTVDFKSETKAADNKVTSVIRGNVGQANASYIADLASKAAADAGFEYTYRDAYVDLYPNYPLNPLAQSDSTDNGYIVYTLRFAEPRAVATTDEVVNQIVQVAFPVAAQEQAAKTFENICKVLAGDATAAAEAAVKED